MKISLSKQQKQAAFLYATTAVGILVGMLSSVINTRALPPEAYGNVRYVQNLISFISSFLLVGFFVSGSRLLALSKDEEYSRRIRGIMCVILAITVGIVMLVMTGMSIYTGFFDAGSGMLSLYLIAIPFCGNVLMLNYVNTTAQGDNHIGRISAARLLPSLLYVMVAYFVFKYFGASSELMLLMFNGFSVLVLLIIIISTKPSFKDLKGTFRILNEENKKYGFNVYLGSLADNTTSYLAGITLGMFCENNANVGFFTLAVTLSQPLTMLPSIIGTTYFKRFASENKISRKVMLGSVGLTLASLILFVLCIKYVVMFLYNESYYCVATYASWLAVRACLQGMGDMINRFLGAHGQGKQLRNGAFACGAVVLTGSFVLVYFLQVDGAIITKILGSLVYLFMMCYYYVKFTRQQKA